MSEAGKGKKWLMPLLVVSVAINLLIIGAIGGMFYHHLSSGGMAMSGMDMRNMNMRNTDMRGTGMRPAASGKRARPALGRPGLMLVASWRLLRELPRERRRALRRLVRERRDAIRQAYGEVAAARARLAEILATEPFDEAAFEQTMRALRAADTQARARAIDLAEAFIKALTPEERKLYAQKIREAAQRRGRRGR